MYLACVRGHCIEAWLGSWRDTRFYVNDDTVIYQLTEAFLEYLEYFCKHHSPFFHIFCPFSIPVSVLASQFQLLEKTGNWERNGIFPSSRRNWASPDNHRQLLLDVYYSLSQNSSKFLTEVLPHPDWWITFCKCIVEKLVVCLKLKKIQISSVINQSRQSHNRNPRTVASRCPPARSQPPAVCFRLFTFHVMQSV